MPALTIADVEKVCAANDATLVMHPAVRIAIRRYEESFYIGACSFLRGESNGLYFLPLPRGGMVTMRFSRRASTNGYPILRFDPVTPDGLARIKAEATLPRSWPVS